jgi:transcription antitermination protein NusB
MGTRRQGREAALKLLYALDMTHTEVRDMVNAAWVDDIIPEDCRDFAMTLVHGVRNNCEEIDTVIRTWSSHWSLARIGMVERNLLRLAIYELLFMPDIPPNVTINEAVEVAKSYGADEAWLFVNGILDRIKHEVTPQRVAGALPEMS